MVRMKGTRTVDGDKSLAARDFVYKVPLQQGTTVRGLS